MASQPLLARSAAAARQLGRSTVAGPSRVRLSSSIASSAYTRHAGPAGDGSAAPPAAATASTPQLSPHDRELLTRMLRVDHAGEVAANTIYEAQARVFGRMGDPETEKLMLEMWETEKKHLAVVRQLLQQHRVPPSKLMPLWSAAGSLLGGVTALLGKEAAMACTEAVETVIGEHYDDQLVHLRTLTETPAASASATTQAAASGEPELHPSLPLLADVITEFRDDELEHLDTAVEHDAQMAPAHALLSAVVGWGCRGAIAIAGRV